MSNDPSSPQLRAEAEAWLAGAPAGETSPRSAEELLYELRVHQVQIEMQNEALRRSQVELAKARDRYVELYELAPVGYLTLTGSARIAECNITAATLLGLPRKQLLDQPFDRFVAVADQNLWQRNFAVVMAQRGRSAFEVALRNSGGSMFSRQVQADCLRVDTEAGPTLRLTLTDISGRYATEDLLRKLSLAVEQSPESIVITNLAGEIEYVNEAFVNIAGYRRESLIGRNMSILQSGKTPRKTYVELWDALTHGRHWKGDFVNRREDGSEYVESAIITPLRQPDGRITHYVAVKEDITNKKRRGRQPAGGIVRRRGWKTT